MMHGHGGTDAAARLAAGIERQQAGDLGGAAEHYRAVLDFEPENADALHLLGVACYLSKDPVTAAGLLHKACTVAPGNAEIHSNLGAALFALGDVAAAAEAFRAAATLDPHKVDAYANLAAALVRLGENDQAIEAFTAAHGLDPAKPHYLKRLGELCLAAGRLAEAAAWFEKCLAMVPDEAGVHGNIAFALDRLDRPDEAEAHYRRALELAPEVPETASNLAMLLARTGRQEEAEELFARALAAPPDAWTDLADLAGALCNRGDYDKGLPIYEALAAERPGDVALLSDYARALAATGHHAKAIEMMAAALAADPERHALRIALAHSLLREGRTDEAADALKAVPDGAPEHLRARLDLCMLLAGAERSEEAATVARAIPRIAAYHKGLFLRPYTVMRECCDFDGLDGLEVAPDAIGDANLASSAANFLELLSWAESEPQIAALAALHRRWGEAVAANAAAAPLPPPASQKADGRIRLGLISADLRRHSAARFVLPLVEHYDRDRFEIVCFTPHEDDGDELQGRIRQRVGAFRNVAGLSDRDLAGAVRDDRIDILFELNGFTADGRLGALAWRAAPVQISWLGYPFTTGLGAVDYLLTDAPTASLDPAWHTETLLPLAGCAVSYDPLEDVAPAPEPPVVRNGFVTFGTLSSPYKLTRRTVTQWAKTMRRLPGSRLHCVHPAYSNGPAAANVASGFAREGIDAKRLEFIDNHKAGVSHFRCYADIDVVLDTMPLTGGTTTCDALWMGTPVVTRRGPAMFQRLSHGVLEHLGLSDLSVESDSGFVEAAAALAADHDRLRALRQGLRATMRAHPLGDGIAYARHFCDLMEELAARHGLR